MQSIIFISSLIFFSFSAKDMKHRLGFLLQKSDSCDYSSSHGKKEKISSSQR